MNTYAMYLFSCFIFSKCTNLRQCCFCFVNMVYGVQIDGGGGGGGVI